jgi:ABC-2 type transport system ATP-binding protein
VSGTPTLDTAGAIVSVRDLRKSYAGASLLRRRRFEALRGVSLEARAGEVFGLLGPNGAGKTTLIKILLGVVKPTAGSASLFGQPVGSAAARSRVGYLPESLRVDRHHTARSALRYYGSLSRMSAGQIARRSDELLELVGLRGRDRESVRRFSKGMYQRLGLAQALMHDPDLLVLDEPTDGLDPVGRNDVRKVIERLRAAGKTIFLNSHILQEVELICSRVAILSQGQICGTGRIDELSHGVRGEQVTFEVLVPQALLDGGAVLTQVFGSQATEDLKITPLTIPGRTHRIVAKLAEQHEIDVVVDRLRSAGISIVRLEVARPTLEDTFIKLVGAVESAL